MPAIKDLSFENPLLLGPMAGVTDSAFRSVCRRFGAAGCYTEMVSAKALTYHDKKTRELLFIAPEEHPCGAQIFGSDPSVCAEAAVMALEISGADFLDINMGCPVPKIVNNGEGSALMRDPQLVGRIVEAVVAAVDVPVTLKIRTGWSADHRNAPEIARIAEDAGIAALAVHGRTRDQHYTGQAEYDTIAAVKAMLKIPVIANGDIDSPQKAAFVLARTGCDAVMIGRAAQGRPWLPGQVSHFLHSGEQLPEPAPAQVRGILLGHLEALHAFYGEEMGVRIARKHLGWYAKDRPENAAFRAVVNRAQSADEQLRLTRDYFDALAAGVTPALPAAA